MKRLFFSLHVFLFAGWDWSNLYLTALGKNHMSYEYGSIVYSDKEFTVKLENIKD